MLKIVINIKLHVLTIRCLYKNDILKDFYRSTLPAAGRHSPDSPDPDKYYRDGIRSLPRKGEQVITSRKL